MNPLKTAFCILILALAGCSNRNLSASSVIDSDNSISGIVNGKEAKASDVAEGGEANSVVYVYDDGVLCTGVLIAPQLVLTAAHCFFDSNLERDTSMMSVKFQSLVADKNAPLKVKKVITYPSFRPVKAVGLDEVTTSDVHDLAVVVLDQPAPTSVHPAALSKSNLNAIKSVTAFGYGTTINTEYNDGTNTVGILRSTSFSGSSLGMMNGMILVKNASSGICHGDSGGPLFEGSGNSAQNILVGINNFGLPLPETLMEKAHWFIAVKTNNLSEYSDAYPDQDLCVGVNGFVDIASHRQWIVKTAADLGVAIQ